MNQHPRTEDPLQALYESAYPPAHPSVEPSQALQRRVGEMAARRDGEAARRPLARPTLRWAAGAGTLLLVASLGWWSARPGSHRTPDASVTPHYPAVPPMVAGKQAASVPRATSPGVKKAAERPEASAARVPEGQPKLAQAFMPGKPGPLPPRPVGTTEGPSSPTPLRPAARYTADTVKPQPPLAPPEWDAVEAQVRRTVKVRDDFVTLPFPRLAAAGDRQLVAAVEQYRREAAVTDGRLTREVSFQAKGMALADLCDRLQTETGIRLTAGNSVADEKVTVFCEKAPLRDLMRQLSRPFGYTWLRSGTASGTAAAAPNTEHRTPNTGYRYELVQDLKSQLLEEELRNRDRNGALLALEKEIEKFRPYLSLSPDEALARVETAPPQEKALLKILSGPAWAALQMYSRLTSRDLASMRAGEWITFSGDPRPGQEPIPAEIERGVIQVFRGWQVARQGEVYKIAFDVPGAEPVPLAQAPGLRAGVALTIQQAELGRMVLDSHPFWEMKASDGKVTAGGSTSDHSVAGVSPTVAQPDNAVLNARLEREPALRARITLAVEGRYPVLADSPPTASTDAPPSEKRVTTADVLEALHRVTGMPVVADFYTRLYKPETLSVRNTPLFEELNRLADGMRLRWSKDGAWLQFRSTSYYDDRRKEIPNRLLSRWAASRRQHGHLTLDDLCEIAGLSDAQLDARAMGEGARDIWGLLEGVLVRNHGLRSSLRFLADFTPAQRQEAQSAAGLPFLKMPLAQQQRFLALGFNDDDAPLVSLDELAGATLRVDYSLPGWFQWGDPRHPGGGVFTRWVVPLEPGERGRRIPRPTVRERTREAALQAVRRLDPQLRQALLEGMRRLDPRLPADPRVVEEDQIFPSQLDLTFVYIRGAASPRGIRIQNLFAQYNTSPPL